MRRLLIAALVLGMVSVPAANAQLPGGLKKIGKKIAKDLGKDKEEDKQEGKTADPTESLTGTAGATSSRPPANKDKSRKYPPGVSFSSVLNGVKLLPKQGQFRLHHIQTTFIPDDCKSGFVVLRTADGKEIAQFDWKPDRLKKPYVLLNIYPITDLRTGEKVAAGLKMTEPGDYVLDFYLPTEHYFTFPFSVVKVGGDDPFSSGQCLCMKGAWEEWGYLFYTDAKPEQNLQWKVWLRNDGCEEKDIKVHVEIARDADGDVVCTSRPNTTHSIKPDWTRYEFGMVFPEGKEVPFGTYFKAKDLLATDGAYTLTMKIDEKPYGVWKFDVKDSKLQYKGRTVRGEADPLTFIEGGRDAWWYQKEAK